MDNPIWPSLAPTAPTISMCHVQNMVTRGLEAPDEINIFSSSVQWFFQPSQCFLNIDSWKMATKIHEDGVQNTLSMVFAGDSAPHRLQFFDNNVLLSIFLSVANSWNKFLSTLFFAIHIDMLG